jgi:hypothetical protein
MTLLYGRDANGNQVPLLVDGSGIVQTSGGSTSWPGTSSQLTAGDGTAVNVGSGLSLAAGTLTAPGGWQTTYEVDFTTLTPVASYSNGTATIDGKTWTFTGLGANSSASLSAANGLRLVVNSGASAVPVSSVNLSSLGAVPLAYQVMSWARMTSTIPSNANGLTDNIIGKSTTGTTYTFIHRLWYRVNSDSGSPSNAAFFAPSAELDSQLYPSSVNSQYSTTNVNHDVRVIHLVSSNMALFYTGTWSAGWPALSSLQFRGMLNFDIAAYSSSSNALLNPSNFLWFMQAFHESGSSTNTVANLLNFRTQVK